MARPKTVKTSAGERVKINPPGYWTKQLEAILAKLGGDSRAR